MEGTVKEKRRKIGKVKFMVVTGVLSALSIILEFLNFPIFPAFAFLKLDLSSLPALIGGFLLNPLAAVIIETVKVLEMLLKTYTIGIGELSNFICSMALVLPPSIIYFYHRNAKWAIIGLTVGVVCEVAVSALSNYFFIFPMYIKAMGFEFMQNKTLENVILTVIIPFNVIKSVAASIITLLIYKPVSKAVKRYL